MNNRELRNALTVRSGKLTIAANTLTPNIAELLTKCFAGGPIVIDPTGPGPGDEESETTVLTGQSKFLGVDLPIEASFRVDSAGNVQATLKYSLLGASPGPDDWRFSKSFPDLPKVVDWNKTYADPLSTPLDELDLFDACFIVASEPQRGFQVSPDVRVNLERGINFVSRMRPSGVVGLIGSAFGGDQPLTLYGTIHLPSDDGGPAPESDQGQYPWDAEAGLVPGICLQADLGVSPMKLGAMHFGGVSFRAYSPISAAWLEQNPGYDPVLAYCGTLSVPAADIDLEMVGVFEPGGNEIFLAGDFKGVTLDNLAELADVAGDTDLISQLPSEIKQSADELGELQLVHASISVGVEESVEITWVSFTIGMPQLKWNIWTDHFEIESIFCRFEITDPLRTSSPDPDDPFDEGRRVDVTVIGTCEVEGIPIEFGASTRDGFTAYGGLVGSQTVPLKRLMETYLPGVPAPGDFTVDMLRIAVSPGNRYSMAATLAKDTPWTIDLGGGEALAISDVVLWFEYPQGGPFSGYFAGNLEFAGGLMSVRAELDQQLTLSAQIEEVNLNQLTERFLSGVSLPDELPELILSDLIATITPSRGAFSFDAKATLATGEKFSPLGLNIDLPDELTLAMSLVREPKQADGSSGNTKLSLKATMSAGQGLTVSTGLGWNREMGGADYRELQNDEDAAPDDPITLSITANQDIEITLMETTPGGPGKGTYFAGFDPQQWTVTFGFLGLAYSFEPGQEAQALSNGSAQNTGREFTLPFLKQNAPPSSATRSALASDEEPAPPQSGGEIAQAATGQPSTDESGSQGKKPPFSQYIRIRPPKAKDIEMDGSVIRIKVPATIMIGSLELDTELPLGFDMSTFAFKVSHPDGIKVMSKKQDLLKGKKNELFGLSWKFLGAPVEHEGSVAEPRFHHFTLVTQDFNYQLQQAPGGMIEVAYTKASKEPIAFGVSDFALGSNGLSITAEVLDRPATLNGIDTKFSFSGSKLVIVENEVKDLTLSGSGPMPPKLVGDAMVDISMQFQERAGNFTLVAGEAKLQGSKLLKCEGTRFQFQIDGVGLKFVNDGGFHLFFTLTGKARMVLAKSDSKSGALSMLPSIELELNECPLTGDATVLAKHISFLVELPKPVTFPLLGTYQYELRAIGFYPQFEPFANDAAMLISGQIKFAQGKGDVADKKPDLHKLYIGLPEEGKIIPRIYMDKLPLAINMGDAFKLNGVVEFFDGKDEKGFSGEGVLEIKGLPPIAASFGFFRLLREDGTWVRAWFIYIEIRQISLLVPYVKFYLREVGLGFGYRFTLTGIKAADTAGDLKQMISELKKLSRTQGDLAKMDRWARDVEEPGGDPRWTIVLRALFAQNSAAPSPLTWNQKKEEELPCAYMFDVVAAFRSDLTFFMTARGWINTSYGYFVKERNAGNQLEPLFSGFILLSARQKRLLAHLASNPNGFPGHKPPLPVFAKTAIQNSQFSATLLLEPGLAHLELGWPNMLRWRTEMGPLKVERRGGFIFRITDDYLLIGISYQERGKLDIRAGVDLGVVGASLRATADLALGARLMALIEFHPGGRPNPHVYGAIGVDLQIKVVIELWIDVGLFTVDFDFSFEIGFSAALEFGIRGLEGPESLGIRGTGTISVKLMGHRLGFSVNVVYNGSAVTDARKATQKYMNLGLEATDVDTSLPGIGEGESANGQGEGPKPLRSQAVTAPAAKETLRVETGAGSLRADERPPRPQAVTPVPKPLEPPFEVPDYSIFVIRGDAAATDQKKNLDEQSSLDKGVVRDDSTTTNENLCSHFVLVPSATNADGKAQRGFLPVPPAKDAVAATNGHFQDFTISFAKAVDKLEHFNPFLGEWERITGETFSWAAKWDRAIVRNQLYGKEKDAKISGMTLRQYLTQAFVTETTSGWTDLNAVVAKCDPDTVVDQGETLEDERVQNPSDSAYESAVRGAFEQFRGSPFFKHDPTRRYDRLLQDAFRPDTSVYSADGKKADPDARQTPDTTGEIKERQQTQANQVRSMVIESIVRDLQTYVGQKNKSSWEENEAKTSVAFQMGLVFRITGKRPDWLENAADSSQLPELRQRNAVKDTKPKATERAGKVRTFNVAERDFATNPPRFQQVRHYTDAGTIAITWKLDWPDASNQPQDDPEHYLQHYLVRRRDLEGRTPEVTYTAKNADVVHRESSGADGLRFLRPRFQIVDNFGGESAQDLANLPARGRSYLYTVTPIDLAGRAGFPLTLVATRYPNEPPPVPIDGKLRVDYKMPSRADIKMHLTDDTVPELLVPALHVTWTEPPQDRDDRPRVAIEHRILVFRRQRTLPIGNYGLDSETQRPPSDLLPTSNARAMPSDIKIKLRPSVSRGEYHAEINLKELQDKGVFPKDARWRPESWRFFLQTESVNGVPSPLAPVECSIRVTARDTEYVEQMEERNPAEIEWLPRPVQLKMLPPEDQRAVTGFAHVPMPQKAGDYGFRGTLDNVSFQQHPFGLRCIRLNWNQGPSSLPDYPLELTAGYDLLELDVDAHTRETFTTAERLADAAKEIQEVQMLPADQLALTPGDTLTASQWEAWYPSAAVRVLKPEERPPGSDAVFSPWYSWRESILVWPEWSATPLEKRTRETAYHPFLLDIVDKLKRDAVPAQGEPNTEKLVDVQPLPAIKPGDFKAFVKTTSPDADHYGWSVLQRFGLSVTLTLRDKKTGKLIVGDDLLQAVRRAIDSALGADSRMREHLFVELLFQPGSSINLERSVPKPAALLAIVQISLRPTIRPLLQYGEIELEGPAGGQVQIVFKNPPWPCSVINQSELERGQIEIGENPKDKKPVNETGEKSKDKKPAQEVAENPETTKVASPSNDETLTIKLPMHGKTKLFVRAAKLPQIVITTKAAENEQLDFKGPAGNRWTPLSATDPASTYFTRSMKSLAEEFESVDESGVDGPAKVQWRNFCWYAATLNSTDPATPEDEKISLPYPTAAPEEEQRLPRQTQEDRIKQRAEERKKELVEKVLPEFLPWAQRFFDANAASVAALPPDGSTAEPPVPRTSAAPGGPWLATAYARVETPAHAAPDAAGRLTYHHLLQDRWAHNYRYYVRPFDRYAYFWRGLLESPVLFPLGEAGSVEVRKLAQELTNVAPDPKRGGLDVVLDRIYPVDMPVVLSSRRLDVADATGQTEVPGAIWEVIVAQHREQSLMERNQTVARRLGFRHVSFALQRRFIYDDWVAQLNAMLASDLHTVDVLIPSNTPPPPGNASEAREHPAIPDKYPDQPDHLPIGSDGLADPNWKLSDASSLDLPRRISNFQQGALVLQWEGLPFFYEHQLLLIAQAATTVSPVNRVVQRDFEYRSPTPVAWMTNFDDNGSTQLELRLPLRPFWDSLSVSAQAQWPAEKPSVDQTEKQRKPASLPDREVTYQLVALFDGNIEVQAEFAFEQGDYVVRQLGRRYKAKIVGLLPPPDQRRQDDYVLRASLDEITEMPIQRPEAYNSEWLGSTRDKLEFPAKDAADNKTLRLSGVLTRTDRNNLLINSIPELRQMADNPGSDGDEALQERFLEQWYASRNVSMPPDLEQAGSLAMKVSCVTTAAWTGSFDAEKREILEGLIGTEATERFIAELKEFVFEVSFDKRGDRDTLARLATIVDAEAKRFSVPDPPQDGQSTVSVRCTGLYELEKVLARLETAGRPSRTFVEAVRRAAQDSSVEVTYLSTRKVPPELAPHFKPTRNLLRISTPLTKDETKQLQLLLPQQDQQVVDQLTADLRDRQAIDKACQQWVFEEPISAIDAARHSLNMPTQIIEMAGYAVVWHGLMNDEEQTALEQYALDGDRHFRGAVRRLIQAVRANPCPRRTSQRVTAPDAQPLTAPPPPKLSIGRALLRHEGHMTTQQAATVEGAFAETSDKQAARRLFEKSNTTRAGLDLLVMSRRGSAAPSKMEPVTAEPTLSD